MAIPHVLLSKLYKYMQDGMFSDFTICIGSSSFAVHKFVLAMRSPFFRALFETPMRESQEQKLNLDDVEATVFELFLEFIYTGEFARIQEFENNAPKLIFCGVKYQVPELVDKCNQFLRSTVAKFSPDSAANGLISAHLLQLTDLHDSVITAVSRDWERIARSKFWAEIIADHDLATSVEKSAMKEFSALNDKGVGYVRYISYTEGRGFTWTINKAESPKRSSEYAQSPEVAITNDDNDDGELFPWKLRVENRQDKTLSFYLVYTGTEIMPLHILGELSVQLYSQGQRYCRRSGVIDFGPSCCRVQLLNLNPSEQELPSASSALYCGDHISLKLDLTLRESSCSVPARGSFQDFHKNRQFADGEVILNNQVFKVHKALFSAACGVFEEKFSFNSRIDIAGIEYNAFHSLSDFIYDSSAIQQSSGVDVLTAAYHFGLQDELMDRLRNILIRQFNFENVMPILRLAHNKRDKFLIENAFEFIFLHFSSMVQQPSWKIMGQKPSLHGEFFEFIGAKLNSI
ncbi:Hypothetical protein NTJ_05009 [Nesidiocoris tenuis]|uniref:BTB domain-containing protein n=1 Tax=Nesidiocoris tenuis TaxID=355587 RepID=A0ABN7AIW2_9HEMI|nr:Hypothetical protein NTJ_05009 [Nesidiocoris tenuis]